MKPDEHETDSRTLIDAAADHLHDVKLHPVSHCATVNVATVPQGFSVQELDLEKFASAPNATNAATTHETPKSFCEYVNAFHGDQTRVFASLADKRVISIIDYHSPEVSRWCEHAAIYPAKFHPSFAAWHAINDRYISQIQFARFLEDRADDAVKPDAASLYEIAEKFSAVRNVNFKSAVNLATGEREFKYDEKDDAQAKGSLQAPKLIMLRTPVFYGCDPVEWVARFAYDIEGGKLQFKVTIHRLEELLDNQFERLVQAIAVDLPQTPIHRGSAETQTR